LDIEHVTEHGSDVKLMVANSDLKTTLFQKLNFWSICLAKYILVRIL